LQVNVSFLAAFSRRAPLPGTAKCKLKAPLRHSGVHPVFESHQDRNASQTPQEEKEEKSFHF
jgi:hypothetical protein